MVVPLENTVLGTKYRLIEPIGQGGMGQVWRAVHLVLDSPVAVKLISFDLALKEDGRRRFFREARVAASLRGEGIVQVLDFGTHGDLLYLVMELLEGESLEKRLSREGKLGASLTAHILRQVGRAVDRAHVQGVVHRDLKPANIFLVHSEESSDIEVKLVDFGIAKARSTHVTQSPPTGTGAFLGSPQYASPEQAQGLTTVDQRTDIWSMGIIAYECLLGEPPFIGATPTQVLVAVCTGKIPIPSQVGKVPQGFDQWFTRTCNRDVDARFGSARDAVRAMERSPSRARRRAAAAPIPGFSAKSAFPEQMGETEPPSAGLHMDVTESMLDDEPPKKLGAFSRWLPKMFR